MVGITSMGVYLPFMRLSLGSIKRGLRGERALANFDEDSITMAVAAAIDCVQGLDRESVDALFFASTTAPYKEKQAATIVASALDLRRNLITADYANSLKCGTSALRSAVDAVAAGSVKRVLLTAADTRLGAPGSPFEQSFADGAAALMIGNEGVVATFEDSYSVCHEIMDIWRTESDIYVNASEGRFAGVEGYMKITAEAVSGLLKKTGLRPDQFSKVIIYSPDSRSSAQLAGKLGFDPGSQLQTSFPGLLGNTGTSFAFIMLAAALEKAKPGDKILLASYGNGADAFLFQVTEHIDLFRFRRNIEYYLSTKQLINDYQTYLFCRGILPGTSSPYPIPYGNISAPALSREVNKNLRLHGAKCLNCGTVQYPPQRVCTKCREKDTFTPVRLSDKEGKVFSFSLDHVSSVVDSPAVITIVDFDGGGRMECFMTDRIVDEIKIGMHVEMTFRRLFQRENIVNYFWKAKPVRS